MSAEKTWKKPEGEATIEFIRPSKLTEEDNGRVLVEGVFIETLPNHYDDTKVDYKIEKEDGSVAVINGAGNLGFRMKSISPGDLVQITYCGKQEISKGKFKGRQSHNFEVLIGE
jgi:hypothetical protein